MELLLWLYLYDPRWFLDSKLIHKIFKYLWVIPLISHITFIAYSAYILIISRVTNKRHPIIINDIFNECGYFLNSAIYGRISFSLLIALMIVLFEFKIHKIYQKENKFFKDAESIFPMVKINVEKNWMRRKALMSCSGILLLFFSIISFIWSSLMINFNYLENKFQGCDYNLVLNINLISIFIFLSNIPVIILIFFTVFLKINSFFCAYMCPKILKSVSGLFNHDIVKFDKEYIS
jgi:hypothetical protein